MLFSIDGHFVTKRLSSAFFEILSSKHIGVTSLTFQDHVTSSITYTIRFHIGHFLKRGLLEPSLSNQWSNYEGAWPPERLGGPLETHGLRGYKGAAKRPPEITRQIQYMIARLHDCVDYQYHSMHRW